MKWKRVKGTKLVKDKVDGQLKPIMAPNVTSTQQHGGGHMGQGGVPGGHPGDMMGGVGGHEDGDDMDDSMDEMGEMPTMTNIS